MEELKNKSSVGSVAAAEYNNSFTVFLLSRPNGTLGKTECTNLPLKMELNVISCDGTLPKFNSPKRLVGSSSARS